MQKNLVELVFIIDKSGSMSGLEKDTVGGFNSLIEKQKQEGEAIVSTVLFSDQRNVVHNRIDIKEVPVMTLKDYCPSGCTALLDAVGHSINYIVNIHKQLEEDERPSKTIFIITTDGMENSSREFSYKKIKQMIDLEKEKYGWEFIFLGANMEAMEDAARIGIDAENACEYNCDSVGTSIIYESLNIAINETRKCKKMSTTWRQNIDKDKKNRRKN